MSSVLDAGPVVRTNQLDYDEEVIYKATQYLYDHVRRRGEQPFCLTVSMTHPHDPYAMTKDYWDMYADVDIPLPKTSAIPQDQQDPHSQRVLKCIDLYGHEVPEERIRAARRAYFAACTYVDTQIGKLLSVLDNCGLSEDTIVVFTGDHGDMLGERGLWYKMVWYEMAARVPMIVYAPKRYEAKHVKENVSTMDLLPTFVAMAGATLQPNLPLDGISLMPYIAGEAGVKTDTVLGEYMGEGTLSPLIMIRRGRWKFVFSPIDPPQLYDLKVDPLENVNLAAGYPVTPPIALTADQIYERSSHLLDPSGIVPSSPPKSLVRTFSNTHNDFTPPQTPAFVPKSSGDISPDAVRITINAFLTEVASRWNLDAVRRDVLASQRRRRFINGALQKGVLTPWDYTPKVDGTAMYIRNHGTGPLEDVEWMSRWPRVPSV